MRVAIIGGGIVGLYLAWKLAENGNKVKVFEKKKEIGKKECSGLVSEKVFDFIPGGRKLIKNQIDFVLVRAPKKTFKIEFKEKFYILDHEELDKEAGRLAKKAGAEIILGRPMNNLPAGFDRTVGCDGYNSFVRNRLKIKNPCFRVAIQGFLKDPSRENSVEAWAVKNGFIWKIPRINSTEYGIIASSSKARKIFEDFCKERRLILENIQSSVVPQGLSVPKNSFVTLCGDAAGLTKPWSGGGIVWGLIAADMLISTFPDFINYQKTVKRFFLPKIIISKALTGLGYFAAFKLPWVLPGKFRIRGDFLT